jgi:uncharacterized protein involved in exopolysaccharide biosynthesis
LEEQKKTGQNIDQIRDLIFGEQIRDYDRKFKDSAQQLKKLNDTLEVFRQQIQDDLKTQKENIDQQLKKISQSIKTIEKELNQEIQTLRNDKTDRLQLANLFIDLGMRLKGEDVLQAFESNKNKDNHD